MHVHTSKFFQRSINCRKNPLAVLKLECHYLITTFFDWNKQRSNDSNCSLVAKTVLTRIKIEKTRKELVKIWQLFAEIFLNVRKSYNRFWNFFSAINQCAQQYFTISKQEPWPNISKSWSTSGLITFFKQCGDFAGNHRRNWKYYAQYKLSASIMSSYL